MGKPICAKVDGDDKEVGKTTEKIKLLWFKIKKIYYKYFCRHKRGKHIKVSKIVELECHGMHAVEYRETCRCCGKYRDYVYGYLTEWKTKKEED